MNSVPALAILSQYGQANSVSLSLIIILCDVGGWELVCDSVPYSSDIWKGKEEKRKT